MGVTLQTIGVIVKDMKRTLDFYRTLGLPIALDAWDETNLDVDLPNGVTLGFLSEVVARQADPTFQTPQGAALNLQFRVEGPHEVDAVHSRLTAAGHPSHAAPWDAPWGQRFARVVDPDGRIVNIYAFLATS
jgi:catechol 2,3-dioxygenase-like lactoylglutathione lyase family enzyme